MSGGYTKLFGSILGSTVWVGQTPATKLVWVTLMALADRDGVVTASVPGLAKFAEVSRAECEQALNLFLAPDPDSSSKEYEGRRIEPVDRGWRLLTYAKHRERMSPDDVREKAAERKRRQREREAAASRDVTPGVTLGHASSRESLQAEAEAEAEAERDSFELVSADSKPPAFTFPADAVVGAGAGPWPVAHRLHEQLVAAYPGVDVAAEYPKALAWLATNRPKRKTRSGMPKFLNSWLARQQNDGSRNVGSQLRVLPALPTELDERR